VRYDHALSKEAGYIITLCMAMLYTILYGLHNNSSENISFSYVEFPGLKSVGNDRSS
jgi:hypothetical protein